MSQPEQSPSLRLSLLGSPRIERDGEPLRIATRKAVALLAYLAMTKKAQSREAVAAMLWPEYEQDRAYANLRRTLWALRNAIGADWLDADRETVTLASGAGPSAPLRAGPSAPFRAGPSAPFRAGPSAPLRAGLWLDVDAFRDRLAECAALANVRDEGDWEACSACLTPLAAAADLYRDDFMAGFTLPDCPAFDEWQFFEREGLRSELASALQKLARCHAAQQNLEQAIVCARRWLALDQLDEAAHRELMRLYAWDGQRAAALRQYQECVRALEAEVGAPPEHETTRLYEAVQARTLEQPAAVAGPQPAEVEASRSHKPRTNLPAPPTSFVGREAELAEIARLLQNPDCRLLTLTGPGGVGKSRLALEAAAGQLDLSPTRYAHGVFFVPLAPVHSAAFIVPTIASALDFSFYPVEKETPVQQLLNYLCEKQMLLVLDDFEHLVDSAGLLSEFLARAPGLRLLVTSRGRLNLQPEWVFEVAGLGYPEDEEMEPLDTFGAIQLFLRRASQADAGFSVPEAEIPDLVRICRLVEGMPLGIELSAAWVRMFSCREIANEIERGLDFLSTSLRDVPERHRSLRAVCDQSWALLSEEEKGAFKRLSVFQGGFHRQAAGRVAGADLPLLTALVDKSLVRRERSGRYELHGVLCQYAAEKLGLDPKAETEAHDVHCAFFAAFLQQMEAALKGEDQIGALEGIAAELQNIRAAWGWAVEQGHHAQIRDAAPSLWLFYEMRGLMEEGKQAFSRAVSMLEVADEGTDRDMTLGLALAFQGRFAGRLQRLDDAQRLLRRALALLRRLGARRELALANSLCFYPGAEDSLPDAERLLEESLTIYRELGDRWGIAFALSRCLFLGSFLWGAETQMDALKYLQESLRIGREIGDQWTVGLCLFQMGQVLQSSGAYDESKEYYDESLLAFRSLGDRHAEQMSLDHSGYLARMLGDYDQARQYHLESLAISQEKGDRLGAAGSHANLGLVARDLGQHEEAERYLRQALAIREEVGQRWTIALTLGSLGDVALAQGKLEEARHWYSESMEVGQVGDAGPPWEGLMGLGEVHSAEGDYVQARHHLRDALQRGAFVPRPYAPERLECLAATGHLACRTGDKVWAAELLAYVAGHPACTAQVRARAQRLLDELARALGPEAMEVARERYRDRPVGEVVEAVLQAL